MNLVDNIVARCLNGVRYAVREAGPADGAVMILLHGLLDTGASFAPLVAAIEARRPGYFRFVAPDWRGHGATQAIGDSYWFPDYLADLDRLIDSVSPDPSSPITLIGHSMGGQAASLYAGIRPARIAHLITLDSLNIPNADCFAAPARYRRWLDAKAEPPQPRRYADVEKIAALIGRRYPELDAPTRMTLAREWSQPGVDGGRVMRHDPWHGVNFPYGFRADEAMAIWREVSARVLCVDAADSQLRGVNADAMARRRACFAMLEYVVLADCGHMLHLQRPQPLAGHICAHLGNL